MSDERKAAMGLILAVVDFARSHEPPARLTGSEAVRELADSIEDLARGWFGAEFYAETRALLAAEPDA